MERKHESIRTYRYTPWGNADSATHYGNGLVFYGTPSHGGFKVGAGLLKRIPEFMQRADRYTDGTKGWYEEDCGWSIVAVCLPEFFTADELEDATRIAERYYPDAMAEFRRLAS